MERVLHLPHSLAQIPIENIFTIITKILQKLSLFYHQVMITSGVLLAVVTKVRITIIFIRVAQASKPNEDKQQQLQFHSNSSEYSRSEGQSKTAELSRDASLFIRNASGG